MGQRDVTETATFTAGFDLAYRLRDPEFRGMLKRLGWDPGQHIVLAEEKEPVIDVVGRMIFHETGRRVIIAIVDDVEEYGFLLLGVEVVRPGRKVADPIHLDPGASIGMLYASLEPCGTYVPSEWTQKLLFERVG